MPKATSIRERMNEKGFNQTDRKEENLLEAFPTRSIIRRIRIRMEKETTKEKRDYIPPDWPPSKAALMEYEDSISSRVSDSSNLAINFFFSFEFQNLALPLPKRVLRWSTTT